MKVPRSVKRERECTWKVYALSSTHWLRQALLLFLDFDHSLSAHTIARGRWAGVVVRLKDGREGERDGSEAMTQTRIRSIS